MALGSVPAALLTLIVLRYLADSGRDMGSVILPILGCMLIITAIALLAKTSILKHRDSSVTIQKMRAMLPAGPFATALGAVLGVLVTLTSIGAGAFGVVALLVLKPHMPLQPPSRSSKVSRFSRICARPITRICRRPVACWVKLDPAHLVYVLPNLPWARRLTGIFANLIANDCRSRAIAVLTHSDAHHYRVHLRTPEVSTVAAGVFCGRFPSGGGRASAGGINFLPQSNLDLFLNEFDQTFHSVR